MKDKLKKVHIGKDVWKIGAQINRNSYGKQTHTIIYGPNRKEYHIYDKDVDFITKPDDDEYIKK